MPHQADNRSRSRSPYRASSRKDNSSYTHRHRSRSLHKDRHRHHHRHHHHSHHKRKRSASPTSHSRITTAPDITSYIPTTAVPSRPVILPSSAKPLSKFDVSKYRPLFASYLDIQKSLYIEELPAEEVKGRWKSFVKRWNSGQLAAGWYDPSTLERAIERSKELEEEERPPLPEAQSVPEYIDGDEESDGDVGPAPPPPPSRARGAAIPTREDLTLRDEALAEAAEDRRFGAKVERRAERQQAKDRLDELVPRAEAGTRERQLEKKREAAASHKAFGDAKGGGDGVAELPESELLGGEDGGGVRGMKEREQRRKNEREIKREEILRARMAEREERMQGLREREDRTMEMLKGLARERFG